MDLDEHIGSSARARAVAATPPGQRRDDQEYAVRPPVRAGFSN
jgi:hypothetical protein